MTILDDDESLAYEIIKALEYDDYIRPINGIPKIVRLLQKYRKPTLHDQVLAFHKRFGQSIGEKPHVPDEKTMRFRLSLIVEELFELLDSTVDAEYVTAWNVAKRSVDEMIKIAKLDVDLPEFIDALADLAYVMEGTAITMGVDMMPIAEEVQRANMAKLPSYVAAKDAMHHGEPVKRADGKILKPPGWTPPDILGELVKQGFEETKR
jgi:predicted HAD superfamily Cof-like phosphohydrolase